jgi:hypothetical protein
MLASKGQGEAVSAMSDQSESLGCSAFFVLFIIAVSWWGSGGWIDWLWYAVKYTVSPSQVEVTTKPKDCDFWHVPLGRKECHYKAIVAAYNANGDLVGGDNAPRYGRDTKTGKPIISYNNGTTWDWLFGATDVPSRTVAKGGGVVDRDR